MAESQEQTPAQELIGDFSPKLVSLTDDMLFGDVWERTELSKRDRSLITVAALIAGGNTEQLSGHLMRAKDNGLTETELKKVITHRRSIPVGPGQCLPLQWQNEFLTRNEWLLGKEIPMVHTDFRSGLQSAQTIEITVIGRASGRPISLPIWFALDGTKLYLIEVEGIRDQVVQKPAQATFRPIVCQWEDIHCERPYSHRRGAARQSS